MNREEMAKKYWGDLSSPAKRRTSHWRDHFKTWDKHGDYAFEVFTKFRMQHSPHNEFERIIEFGCGGGSITTKLAKIATEIVGIDISKESLYETKKQLNEMGFNKFYRIYIEPDKPVVPAKNYDLFVCVSVFHHLPGREYAKIVLKEAYQAIDNGGFAFIQIRVGQETDHFTRWTMYPTIHDYIDDCREVGWSVRELFCGKGKKKPVHGFYWTYLEKNE